MLQCFGDASLATFSFHLISTGTEIAHKTHCNQLDGVLLAHRDYELCNIFFVSADNEFRDSLRSLLRLWMIRFGSSGTFHKRYILMD